MVSRWYGIWNDWIRFKHPLRAPVAADGANDVQMVKTAIATTHRVAHGNERPGIVRCEARQNEFHTVNVTALDA